MTESQSRQGLDASTPMTLHEGEALRVLVGQVLVFAVPATRQGPGRRLPVRDVVTGGDVHGVQIDGVDMVVVGLPGTEVESIASDPEATSVWESLMRAALDDGARAGAAAASGDAASARHDFRLVDDALLGLAAVVPGQKPDLLGDVGTEGDVSVVNFMARQIGLRPMPLQLRRAMADAEISGRDPVTALAAAAGAAIRRVTLVSTWWRQEGPAVMLRSLSDGTSVAAVWRRGAYHLWTPGRGLHDVVNRETAVRYSRAAIVFEPLLDPTKPARIEDLLNLGLRGSRRSTWLVLGLTGVIGVLAAVIPKVAGELTTTIASQTRSSLLVVAAALVAFALGDLLLRAVRSFALLRIRGRGTAAAATAVWDRILRLPMAWHNQRTVASRMADANAIDTASTMVPGPVVTAMLDIATIAGAFLGVLTTSGPLALGLLVFLVIRALAEISLVRRAARLTKATQDSLNGSQAITLDVIAGVNRLRASGATQRAFARWAQQQAETTELEVRQRALAVFQQSVGVLWPTIGLAVLLGVTAVTGASVGELVTAQTALTAATTAVAAAIASVGAVLSARAVLASAQGVLDAQPESGTGQEVARLEGALDLRDVVFGYSDDSPPVLEGVSLSVRPGQHVAIVGPSGCGKSTLLRLILGLEPPRSGIIIFDGRDITALDRSSVRRQIGSVMQSSLLLPGSIRDNVDMGRELSIAQVWDALERAAVADEVRAMPMGVLTVIVEGVGTISGGQRQRILLARALAGNPRILILDEATSALDNISQAAVVASLDELAITRVVVAHRLSTIERADLIVMLDDGRVVAEGTFNELISSPGPFRDLVSRQQL